MINLETTSPEDRYDLLIRTAAAKEEIFTIENEEEMFVTVGTKGNQCIPVWSVKEHAEGFISEDWSECKVRRLPLEEFLDMVKGLEDDGYLIAGSPNEAMETVIVSPEEIKEDLEMELGG